jgi:hypothetical protein
MKKKLFVWYYPHIGQTCALTEDGELILIVLNSDHKKTVERLFKDNAGLQNEFDIVVVDQKTLEAHLYESAPRETLNEDFRKAWDNYRIKQNPVVN